MCKYIVIRDYQGGEFGMYRDYTAEEWGNQAYEWAKQDDWENPEECLLNNFKDEKSLIDYIAEIWQLEIVKLDKNNKELIEFLNNYADDENYVRESNWVKKVLKELEVK